MEFVNQFIAFLTPYFGEYARYAPMAIGAILAIIAVVIRRRVLKQMRARKRSEQKKGTDTQSEAVSEPSSETPTPTTASDEQISEARIESALSSSNEQTSVVASVEAEQAIEQPPLQAEKEEKVSTLSWSQRIKSGLSRTRQGLGGGLSSILVGSKKVDDDLLEELETQLLVADVGIDATRSLIDGLTEKHSRKELKDSNALLNSLKGEMTDILSGSQKALDPTKKDGPFVILMVGVNGVGKTTTIGKLTKKYQAEGKSVMLAAGDTFRAAAVEQLQVWGERNNVPVVAQHTGADSASVIYDAIESAKAKGVDVVIADTAGRLQNKANLMNELSKVVRVMKKLDVDAPHEVMLVLDAGTGQNALSQAKLFTEAVGVSGITLTKLDGTAKGGIIFAIAKQFGLPIRYIGVGEQVDDLRPFVAQEFVDALFDSE
ncbi:Signal recognition particle receptor FtsY [Marinomonas spartinae]|uniref:signal recognition particle-docking protein FtsY n=1 Tax=Marinomonas spartinae TaxID=1792290 RepID=UPI000808D153|nr:signal recognition particle-docking protein FtsY [Marinomonas spartinae]SBS25590.1 Signal recognition particle receptor FtsY [Marinomonas spartinae]